MEQHSQPSTSVNAETDLQAKLHVSEYARLRAEHNKASVGDLFKQKEPVQHTSIGEQYSSFIASTEAQIEILSQRSATLDREMLVVLKELSAKTTDERVQLAIRDSRKRYCQSLSGT